MPNIYYCQSLNRGCGILRAVLSWEEGINLLEQLSFCHTGQQFPTTAQDPAADFAVLRILDEELDEEWRPGFYRFDADIMRIEEVLQACTAMLSEVGVEQAKRQIPKRAPVKKRVADSPDSSY
jgi:hypothetical protein